MAIGWLVWVFGLRRLSPTQSPTSKRRIRRRREKTANMKSKQQTGGQSDSELAKKLFGLPTTLNYLSGILEDYNDCDTFLDFENKKEIHGIEAALINYDTVIDNLRQSEKITANLPNKELANKAAALLYAIYNKLGQADEIAKLEIANKNTKEAIICIKEAFERANSLNSNLAFLSGELVVFLEGYFNRPGGVEDLTTGTTKGKPCITQKEAYYKLRKILKREQGQIQQTGRLPKIEDMASEIGCSPGLLYKEQCRVLLKAAREGLKTKHKPKERQLKKGTLTLRPDDKIDDPAEIAESSELAKLKAESAAEQAEQDMRREKYSKAKQEKRTGNIAED
jgi:hypothetical protein